MIVYRFLDNIAVERLYEAFLAGFADYQVDMRTSLAEFEYRLLRDGVDPTLSAGCFVDDELVGFTFNGKGVWQGHNTVYDAGTAVLPEHRGRGIATKLFEFMIPMLRDRGYTQYLLEVMTSNESAARLYRRLGFKDSRRFAVFRYKPPLLTNHESTEVTIFERLVPDWALYKTFGSGYPAWQNSIDAVLRVDNTVAILEAHIEDRCIGYGIVSESSGNLFQLAVDKNCRRRGVGRTLLSALQNRVTYDHPIKVNNVDEDLEDTIAFFRAVGFDLVLEQYELTLTL
jgi:ribosomal protein S18 acetylase RimI-like enzyme